MHYLQLTSPSYYFLVCIIGIKIFIFHAGWSPKSRSKAPSPPFNEQKPWATLTVDLNITLFQLPVSASFYHHEWVLTGTYCWFFFFFLLKTHCWCSFTSLFIWMKHFTALGKMKWCSLIRQNDLILPLSANSSIIYWSHFDKRAWVA